MKVTYSRHINKEKNNRIEFLINNWDYVDGGDYIAKILCEEFGMVAEEKVDHIWFTVIKLHLNDTTYDALWHEDVGNMIYSIEQDENSINILEQRLKIALGILNKRISESITKKNML